GVPGFGGIAGQTHLAFVQTLDFALFTDSVADHHTDDLEARVRGKPDPQHIGANADHGRDQLPTVAVEQALHVAGDAIEPVTVRAIGEQAERQNTPGAAYSVHSDGAHWVVDF